VVEVLATTTLKHFGCSELLKSLQQPLSNVSDVQSSSAVLANRKGNTMANNWPVENEPVTVLPEPALWVCARGGGTSCFPASMLMSCNKHSQAVLMSMARQKRSSTVPANIGEGTHHNGQCNRPIRNNVLITQAGPMGLCQGQHLSTMCSFARSSLHSSTPSV
jgi:hypothetical protein